MQHYEDNIRKLESIMEQYTNRNIMIAFSGGVDSSLLLKMACDYGKQKGTKVYAITLHTMLHPIHEIENAIKVAQEVGAIHVVLEVDELKEADVMDNPSDRCYRCKKYLFEQVKKKALEFNVDTIIEGTNEDDLHVYRPGIKALSELGILSPLAEAGITKAQVRQLANEYKISVSNRPSAPCLATRFPYGTSLSYEKMRLVEKGEAFIKTFGMYNVRLRVHGEIARIEVDQKDIVKLIEHNKEIISYLKALGYIYVTVDLEGFRSGSMDYDQKRSD